MRGQVDRPRTEFVVLLVCVQVYRLRDYRHLFGLPIDLDHPVVEASVGIPHDVVQYHELFQLLAEGLL